MEYDSLRNLLSNHFLESERIQTFLNAFVAARLRSPRTDDPLNKGHPRSIEKEVEL